MEPYLASSFANPASSHRDGQLAAAAVEAARGELAAFLECEPVEVLFTSGATEACNLAVLGAVRHKLRRGGSAHVVTTSVEHPAVAEPIRQLAAEGARVAVVRASRSTVLSAGDVLRAVRRDTALVAVAYVCSETGAVQPIAEIGRRLATLNAQRLASGLAPILLFTDATQAAPWLPCRVSDLGVHLLALSAHKIYGPKGAGGLYVSRAVHLSPLLYGGSQERGLRPGTVNVPAIVGFAEAIRLLTGAAHRREAGRIGKLRRRLVAALSASGVATSVPAGRSTPGHVHVSVRGVPNEQLLAALDVAGIAASAGHACQAGSLLPSPVLVGSGWSAGRARTAVRLSLGRGTTAADIRRVARVWAGAVARLRPRAAGRGRGRGRGPAAGRRRR